MRLHKDSVSKEPPPRRRPRHVQPQRGQQPLWPHIHGLELQPLGNQRGLPRVHDQRDDRLLPLGVPHEGVDLLGDVVQVVLGRTQLQDPRHRDPHRSGLGHEDLAGVVVGGDEGDGAQPPQLGKLDEGLSRILVSN